MKHVVECQIGAHQLILESGQIARQANAAVLVKYAGSAVLCAVTVAEPPPNIDFFPLTVDYREKAYAAGKIPGGFFKREGRPTTKEVLTSRLMDRPLRPLFPEGFLKDVSVQAMVVSADRKNDPDMLAMVAASAALVLSEVPFKGPVGAVRIGRAGGEFILNPTAEQRESGDLDLVVAGTATDITMVECSAREVSEEVMLDAIDLASEAVRQVCDAIARLAKLAGKPKMEFVPEAQDKQLAARVRELAYEPLKKALLVEGKLVKKQAMDEVAKSVVATLCPAAAEGGVPAPGEPTPAAVKALLDEVKARVERDLIVRERRRADGRDLTSIRPISTELQLLPYAHGSALFTRGETQALVTVTLGTSFDEQRIDGLHDEVKETFMLHYNFPSYSVGETWPNRGPKRREIGHGALAERALRSVLPKHENFPYTLRIVSDITESNGSSSMATVCGGTLALMDAGVQIRQPVAGIAMGLIKEQSEVCILSDILGSEDHHGDMDFKVAGTQRGITALQMDIKIDGVDRKIMKDALEQARQGRIHILREMLTELKEPRPELSKHAPKAIRIQIDPEKIGLVIGPGGKMIKGIQEETGARIEIEDDGSVTIWGNTQESANAAREKIEILTEDVQEGQVYTGRVVSIKDFGAFVEVLPGQEGLVHVSELSNGFVESVADVVRVGDTIEVKVIGIDPQGRIKLSRKAVLESGGLEVLDEPASLQDRGERGQDDRPARPERAERSDRGDRHGRGDRGMERGPRRDRGDRGGGGGGGYRGGGGGRGGRR
ncbi:MAG: polyribonucleotide nucleotidyltransferase [Planctomycetes bacterium]|nr:polyribonucleotide nucleotidyltransferase [Planctomycetota bacterium]